MIVNGLGRNWSILMLANFGIVQMQFILLFLAYILKKTCKINAKLFIKQAPINKQGGKLSKIINQAGSNKSKQAGKI